MKSEWFYTLKYEKFRVQHTRPRPSKLRLQFGLNIDVRLQDLVDGESSLYIQDIDESPVPLPPLTEGNERHLGFNLGFHASPCPSRSSS